MTNIAEETAYETRRNRDVLEMSRDVARLEIALQHATHLNAALQASLRHLLAALDAALALSRKP